MKTGMIALTRGVNDKLAEDKIFAGFVGDSLLRHILHDWGDVCEEDCKKNDYAVDHNLRILSSYTQDNFKIWIITEADRSATTVLFPDEY